MCGIVFDENGREYYSVRELRTLWPRIVFIPVAWDEADSEDDCLCGVDVPETARIHGAQVSHDRAFDDYQILAATTNEARSEA